MIVVGVGNALRGDDAAGLHAAARLRATPGARVRRRTRVRASACSSCGRVPAPSSSSTRCAPAPRPGPCVAWTRAPLPLPATWRTSSSTHACRLGEAIELARILGRLPARVLVHGVEGREFELGAPLSEEVAAAIGPLADAVARDVATAVR